MTTPRAWLTAGLLLTLLTACAGDPEPTPPEPPPSTTSTPETTTFTPPGDVPRVADPLDGTALADFEKAPCTSLTPTQVAELKLDAGKKGTGDNAEQSEDSCVYADLDPATGLLVYINYYPNLTNGLTERYEEYWSGDWPLWRPGEVDGYPAVFFHYNPSDPTNCNVDVGTSDTQVFNVKVFYYPLKGYHGEDICGHAKNIASTILSNIKAAN